MGNNISHSNICRGNSVCQIFLSPSTNNIEDNRSSIEDNRSSIEDNRSDIEENRSDIEENRSDIEDNGSSIEENRSSIDENVSASLINRYWIIGVTIVLILTLFIFVLCIKNKMEKFCWNFCRIKLIVLNFLAMLGFLTIVAISIKDFYYKYGNNYRIEDLWQNPTESTNQFLIVIGLFTFLAIFSFCGCCGACRKNNCMLGIFITILLIFVSTTIAGIVFLYKHHEGEVPFLRNKNFKILFWAISSLMILVLISSFFVCLRKKANSQGRQQSDEVENYIKLQRFLTLAMHQGIACAHYPPTREPKTEQFGTYCYESVGENELMLSKRNSST